MSKLKTLLHIGKIICEVGVITLGIAALFTPAAPIAIAAVALGAIAWGLTQAEDAINDNSINTDCDHASLKISDKSQTDLSSGDDTDSSIEHIDDADHAIVNIDNVPVSGDHSYIIDEV